MEEAFYTHALWRVKPGHEEEFIAAWKALADAFSHLPDPPSHGTLIQSLTDPTLFYSFGPWDKLEDIEAMREDPQARQAIQDVMALCTEATPSSYRVVAEIRL
ncbi:MAG TPA: antibiotic biosynthesis monooxygenase [Chloroflexia bacterium]|nr:antibiotic biosynthesis monooxygenase [Chloroflexia bacterium]